MAKDNHSTEQATFVAIDISKDRNDVLIQLPNGPRRRMKMTNDRVDHDRLVEVLSASGPEIQVGFEATGNYHRPLAWRLIDAGFQVHLISSVALARTREALHNSWDKNDPKDAQVILYMMKLGQVQHYHDPLFNGTNDWQELSKTHEAISKNKSEVLHRLQTHYLPLYFPEIDKFRHNSRSVWFFKFLYRFPTPGLIVSRERERFIEEAWSLIGRKVNKKLVLSDIYDTARSSTGLPVDDESKAIVMYRLVIQQMIQLIEARDEIERQSILLMGNHPDFIKLQQIPGIGPINALTILAEAGDLRRFGHYRQFLKFCGLDLATHQSGQFRGRSKLSKYGNARLRRTFWMAGQIAIRQRENTFRDKFERYTARDRNDKDLRRKALTAVAAKMATVSYSVVKHETDYRPFYGVR